MTFSCVVLYESILYNVYRSITNRPLNIFRVNEISSCEYRYKTDGLKIYYHKIKATDISHENTEFIKQHNSQTDKKTYDLTIRKHDFTVNQGTQTQDKLIKI